MADSTPGPAPGPAAGATFDASRPYRCCPQVALRPEPFGALAYHFGTRRLSFLKTRQLAEVVRTLEAHDDVHAALAAAGVPDPRRAAYLTALAGLAANGTIEERAAP
jgi:putative mycofactocin binding protein MftB